MNRQMLLRSHPRFATVMVRYPRLTTLILMIVTLRLAWQPSAAVCRSMAMTGCLAVAALLIAGLAIAATGGRAGWLAARSSRAIRTLPRSATPTVLAAAARRTGVTNLTCLEGRDPTAFCAGPARPRVYVTAGAAAGLTAAELDAVLCHEHAHARRRDPLRRLLSRAAADVLFFVPLASWCSDRHYERAELAADRTAIVHVGTQAVASALLAMAGPPGPAGSAAFGGAIEARVTQLTAGELPRRRPSLTGITLSAAGLIAALSLFMCVGQAALAALGL